MKAKIVLLLFAGILVVSGCVSQSYHDQQVRGYQNQAGNLMTQVTQLDSQLRIAEVALGHERQKNNELQAELGSKRSVSQPPAGETSALQGVYRTPKGFEVQASNIQVALKNAGYYQGSVDGKVGPATRQALRDFQSDSNLKADGICGPKTWSKLKPFATVIK